MLIQKVQMATPIPWPVRTMCVSVWLSSWRALRRGWWRPCAVSRSRQPRAPCFALSVATLTPRQRRSAQPGASSGCARRRKRSSFGSVVVSSRGFGEQLSQDFLAIWKQQRDERGDGVVDGHEGLGELRAVRRRRARRELGHDRPLRRGELVVGRRRRCARRRRVRGRGGGARAVSRAASSRVASLTVVAVHGVERAPQEERPRRRGRGARPDHEWRIGSHPR